MNPELQPQNLPPEQPAYSLTPDQVPGQTPIQYPALSSPSKKTTYMGTGAKAGAIGATIGSILQLMRNKRPRGVKHALLSIGTSPLFGGIVGGVAGSFIPKNNPKSNNTKNTQIKTAGINNYTNKENDMTMDLKKACEFAKLAADMAVPLEQKPAPEAGSEPVTGMTDNSTFNPASVGASTYASQSGALELQKAKELAACAAAKTAADAAENANQHYSDALSQDTGRNLALGLGAMAAGGLAGAIGRKSRLAAAPFGAAAVGAGLGSMGYGLKRYYDAYKQYKTRPEGAPEPGSNQYYGNNLSQDMGRSAGLGLLATGLGGGAIAAGLKGHPAVAAGLAVPSVASALGGIGYQYKSLYDAYKQYKTRPEKTAAVQNETYATKVASVQETGVTPEEAVAAVNAAAELYEDCIDKLAFAQDLYNEATDYLGFMEKRATEFIPLASSTLGSALGAGAGMAAAGKFLATRPGLAAAATIGGAALGAAAGGLAPMALEHFAATNREE